MLDVPGKLSVGRAIYQIRRLQIGCFKYDESPARGSTKQSGTIQARDGTELGPRHRRLPRLEKNHLPNRADRPDAAICAQRRRTC
jgi:hypothetical protein